ncbi:hypothetical protein P4V72_29715 [Bacillus thuringiensis]|uniref:Terminase small subunit n=1 Tax=Bacillus thuringiensis TaxID=1428 RepID=A0A9W3VCY5_BACTU|nr:MULTISPECIES: P27 family phage terminase small subunit [Bacillus cereus group]AMR04584.1 hypothetical protein AXW78_21380 [Bacillus thuringiensis]AQY40928.1 hypothetical protein B4918_24525 [Bacillus thuringiensis]AYF82694.1 hypothetical protein D7J84_16755 [Bacillus thuringiensis]EOO54906.1 hypothetical protein ICK_01029 [Bacillus cereus BAG1X2-2]MCU5273308.1 P27 family phage terminase small subunit [Bacillus cereus]
MARKSKVVIEAEKKKELEAQRIMDVLVEAGTYSPALDPLIEVYLDAVEIYSVKYGLWKNSNFPTVQKTKNVNGDVKESKHPLAQQVEVWSKQKAKYLGQLGLDGKNKDLIKKSGVLLEKGKTEKEPTEPSDSNKLLQFRQRLNR